MNDYRVIWQPQINKKDPSKPHPQELLVNCPLPIIFYGGARGGAKTDGALGKAAIDCHRYPGANMVFFREEVTQADDLIERAKEIFLPLGAEFKIQQKQFNFPNKSRIRFRGLRTLDDAKKYQGQNLSHAFVEEVGNYHDPRVIWTLFGALRSASGIPTQLVLTGNPGGIGQKWLKKTFYDPHPEGNKIFDVSINEGSARGIFLPAKVTDNYKLLEKDPLYIERLKLTGSPALVRAWLYADWEAVEGAFFVLTPENYCKPFQIPDHWKKYLGQDWGYRDPMAATFLAISSGLDDQGNPHHIPKGKKVVYRCITKKGIENQNQAELVYNSCISETITRASLDPACWSKHGQLSIAEQMNQKLDELNSNWFYQPAINNRIAGWSLLTEWINSNELIFFDNLSNLIDPLLTLPTDPNNVEDVLTTADDHAADSLRYASMQYMMDSVYSEAEPTQHISNGINLATAIKRYKEKARETRI